MAKPTKTTSKTFQQFNDFISKGQLANKPKPTSRETKPALGPVASGNETRASVRMDPAAASRAAGYFRSPEAAGFTDEISDEQAARNAGIHATPIGEPDLPKTPENLPAVISKAVGAHGIHPKWHMVKHLPGYMSSAIRMIGRQVFKPFTRTPIEDIQVLSTLTNPEYELKAMGGWIMRHGHKDHQATIKFQQIFPGYDAETAVWHAEGYTFVVVQDFAGQYIYAWPAEGHNRLT